MKKFAIWATLFFAAALSAQNPQTSTAPIYGVNSKYVQGTGPGYWPTAGSGLTLNVGPGTPAYSCSTMPYTGGTLSMTASTTNYVYLNTATSCVPAVKTTAFTSSDIPLAIVVTSGSAITIITDYRAALPVPSSGGSSVSINGSSTGAPNFNNSTPAAGTNGLNVQFQMSGNNVSAQVVGDGTATHFLNGQGGYTTPAGGGPALYRVLPNDASPGTTLNEMACWDTLSYAQSTIETCPHQSSYGTDNPFPFVGVCVAGCGTSGFATVQYGGNVSWIMDTTVTTAQAIQASTGTDGYGSVSCIGSCTGVDEHPQSSFIFGRVDTGNSGGGTAAIVALNPLGEYDNAGPIEGFNGSMIPVSGGYGGSFYSQSFWQQLSSSYGRGFLLAGSGIAWNQHSGSNGPPIMAQINGAGISGEDLEFDPFSEGVNNAAVRFDGTQYQFVCALTVSGTLFVENSEDGTSNCTTGGSHFSVYATSGSYQFTLSGNTSVGTMAFPNIGTITYWDIIEPASGGPFSWTWGSAFVNAPVINPAAGASTFASFIYDGTSFQCLTGCSAPNLPSLYSVAGTPLPSCASGNNGQTLEVSDATTPLYMTAYAGSGSQVAAVICNGVTSTWLTH